MKILFRVDAAVFIGTGHVIRCMTLARKLMSRGHDCEFLCRPFAGNLIEHISAAGFVVHSLAAVDERNILFGDTTTWLGASSKQEISEIRRTKAISRYDWIVVDHYGLDVEWHTAMRDKADHILVIDDLCLSICDCDVILNQNCGVAATVYDNLVDSKAVRVIGSQYALLRDEFSRWRKFSLQNRYEPKKNRVLISMGGVDIVNAATDVLNALNHTGKENSLMITVVVGGLSPHIESIKNAVRRSRHQVDILVNPNGIAELMASSDIGIGAAGSTTWERCCMGLPSFQVAVADNQVRVCEYLSQQGAIIGYKNVREMCEKVAEDFNITAKDLFELSMVSRDLCDGNGSSGISCVMEDFCL